MTPTPRTRLLRLWAVGACLTLTLLFAAPAHAQDQAFKDGMKAFDDQKWAEAVKFMRAAINSSAQEANRKVEYGGLFGRLNTKNADYLPHYYLGRALFMMQPQDCAAAIDAWSTSEKQGFVQARKEFVAIIQGGYAVCEGKGVLPPRAYDPLAARIQQQYADANGVARTVATLAQQNQEQWRPEMREVYERAAAELETSRTRFSSGTRTRAEKDFTDAGAAADRARVALVNLLASLRSTIEAANTAKSLVGEVEQALAEADADDRQLETRVSRPGAAALTSALGLTRQQGRDALSRAHGLYGTGNKASNPAQLTEARGLARDASTKFRLVGDELTRIERGSLDAQLSEARTGAAQAIRLLDEMSMTLDRRMAANPKLAGEVTAEYEAVRQQSDAVRRRAESARKGENLAAILQATRTTTEMRTRLSELTTRFGRITLRERGVSPALEAGTDRFLTGRYEEALQLLNPAEGFAADDPMWFQIHLFRAASLHTLYQQSRQTKQELLEQAIAEVKECRKLHSTFELDVRAFSPAFIAFYNSGGPPPGSPSVGSARP